MGYTYHLKIWNLNYEIHSDSPEVIRFFERAYSLFKFSNSLKIYLPTKNILIKIRGKNKNIQRIVLNTNAKIYHTLIKSFSHRIMFLHASSVRLEKNFMLFIGGPMSGKSTIAAMLKDHGAQVFNDDLTPIEYNTGHILNFPIFSNIRKGDFSELQKRYLDSLKPYLERFNSIRREYLVDMSEDEFKAYYLYNKQLYSLNNHFKPSDTKTKRTIAIFIKKDDVNISNGLQSITFPQSFNMFAKAIYLPGHIIRKKLKQILKIFSYIDFYILKSHSVAEAVELIDTNFK